MTERNAPAEEAELLLETSQPSEGRRMRLLGRAAFATGMVASVAGVVAVSRHKLPQSTRAELNIPFRLYDTASNPDLLAMPDRADKYNGVEDKRGITVKPDADGNTHIFVIGDWGGTLPDHQTFGANAGWDTYEQQGVADKVKTRAKQFDPQYVLNVGDNFYIGGLALSCQQPPADVHNTGEDGRSGTDAFSQGWQWIYGDVANKPWISALGNHDYGGWRMDQGWPQQIGYSFVNYNWIMPSRYYNKKVQHDGYTVEYFVYDSNAFDAKDSGEDSNHNICGKHNYGGAGSCSNNGGMPDIGACKQWFWDSHIVQQTWLDQKLGESTADWKIIVTHFPCGYDHAFWKEMKGKHGVDLMVTGHRHQQELWRTDSENSYIQDFLISQEWDGNAPACLVTGGGGGISSEAFGYASYGMDLQVYGFFHLTMRKESMKLELINMNGDLTGNWTIFPHGTAGYEKQKKMTYDMSKGTCADFCGDTNNNYNDNVCGWASCAACAECHKKPAPE